MKLVYFAHTKAHYGKQEEMICMDIMMRKLPSIINDKIEIFNPNQTWIIRLIENFKKENKPNHMDFFVQIVNVCDIVAVAPFRDGTLGAGVVLEVKTQLKNNKPVYFIDFLQKDIYPIIEIERYNCLSIEETKERLRLGMK